MPKRKRQKRKYLSRIHHRSRRRVVANNNKHEGPSRTSFVCNLWHTNSIPIPIPPNNTNNNNNDYLPCSQQRVEQLGNHIWFYSEITREKVFQLSMMLLIRNLCPKFTCISTVQEEISIPVLRPSMPSNNLDCQSSRSLKEWYAVERASSVSSDGSGK